MTANNRIFISVGDISGEIHACNLVKEIKKINPLCHICAVGGNDLKLIVDEFFENIVDMGVFGFLSLKQFFYLKKVLSKLKRYFTEKPPDKIILIDYYGFHIFVAKFAKKLKIPVYYYISPQVWASRSGRVKKLGKVVKKMLLILPFEDKLYKYHKIDAVFVGNPLIDIIPRKHNFNINSQPVIGLFPGSRENIVKRHIPVLFKTAKILKKEINAKFIMFVVKNNFNIDIPEYIKLETSKNLAKRMSIDFAICPSGTVSLENALMGIPMTVIYKLSYLNYFIIRLIIKTKYITIINILSAKKIIPELIQFNANPKKIAHSVLDQLNSKNYMLKAKELIAFRKQLGTPGVSKRTAQIILRD
ncbi:MAG: lipid-A-disaccharide synthase [Endomicrobium sp.]|jgi:lipid-A-disaccharide synthase|nr:lipid-A-disaccharide synthase [Endomicrobium sp.]